MSASTTSSSSTPFTITANPNTDIWRKPPSTDVFNAPFHPSPTSPTPRPLSTFISARATFSFPWSEQYDQAGLLLSFHRTSTNTTTTTTIPPKWIKTGIEYYNGHPQLSTVACDAWADWSVTPLSYTPGGEKVWTTISIERETGEDGKGVSLWVYLVEEGGEGGKETKRPLREICWVYGDEPEKWEVGVSVMAARPEKGVSEGLVVEVRDFVVVWE